MLLVSHIGVKLIVAFKKLRQRHVSGVKFDLRIVGAEEETSRVQRLRIEVR